MKKILEKLMLRSSQQALTLFWIVFVLGASTGSLVVLLTKKSQNYPQAGAGLPEIFLNNLKVAMIIIVTGMLTKTILPYIILLLNSFLWGIIFTTNLQVIGFPLILLFGFHVPLELFGFHCAFRIALPNSF